MRLISYYTALWSSSCCWIYPAAPATLKITVENIVQARSWHSMNLTEFSRPGKQRSYEGETENGQESYAEKPLVPSEQFKHGSASRQPRRSQEEHEVGLWLILHNLSIHAKRCKPGQLLSLEKRRTKKRNRDVSSSILSHNLKEHVYGQCP